MKKVKKFFNTQTDRLNKGYEQKLHRNNKLPFESIIGHKNFERILPPIDLISQYEEIYPGILEQLVEITKQEQRNKLAVELASIESNNRTVRFGYISVALVLAILICCGTLLLMK